MILENLLSTDPANVAPATHCTPARRNADLLGSTLLLIVAGVLLMFAIMASAGTFVFINYLDFDSLFYSTSNGAPISLYGGYVASALLAALAVSVGIVAHQIERRVPDHSVVYP